MRVQALGEATSLADRKRCAGQSLLLRWPASHVTDDLRRVVREIRPAGFVIEADNCIETEQLAELTRELGDLVDPHYPALIATALRRPVPESSPWPDGSVPWSDEIEAARALAAELRALGLDLYLGPGIDGHTAALVDTFAEAPVAAVPGPLPASSPHGDLGDDMVPLLRHEPHALRVGRDLTGLSRALRVRNPYPGPLLMEASDLPEALVDALKASVDLILTTADPEPELTLFASLVRLQERDTGAERACRQSLPRLQRLRERLFLEVSPRPDLAVVGDPDHLVVAKILSGRYRES